MALACHGVSSRLDVLAILHPLRRAHSVLRRLNHCLTQIWRIQKMRMLKCRPLRRHRRISFNCAEETMRVVHSTTRKTCSTPSTMWTASQKVGSLSSVSVTDGETTVDRWHPCSSRAKLHISPNQMREQASKIFPDFSPLP